MRLKLFLITVTLSVLNAFSQGQFEKGYFIKNDGSKVNCFIKLLDWNKNPTTFQFKLSENAQTETGQITNVKEFGSNTTKYVRATTLVNQSSEAIAHLTYDRNPELKEETLFLEVLIEGKASLYYISRATRNLFFYRIDDENIEQLIYKSYLVTYSKKGENNRYKQQLANALQCENLNVNDFEKLKYKTKNLIAIFKAYNTCIGTDFTSFVKMQKREKAKHKGKLNLQFRPGITFSKYYTTTDIQREDFENKTGYRIGLELEYIFPSKNHNWAMFIEPSYRNYESQKVVIYEDFFINNPKYTTLTVKKNSFDIVAGPRYYIHLGEKSSLFADISLLLDTNINSEQYSGVDLGYYTKMNPNLGTTYGLGYRYKNKLSLQFRYNKYGSTFSSTAFVFGYNFL